MPTNFEYEREIKVVVIIPVYKVEKYLESSVKSVLNQTYRNIEIILVDDGSPDKCPEICDYLAKENKNIRVIHKENGGLSSARNKGIEHVSTDAKYVLFLDSDDQLLPESIEGMVKKAIETDAEMVIPDRYIKVYEGTGETSVHKHFPENMYIEQPKEFALRVLIENGRAWRASCLLYSYKAIIESEAKFPEGHISEDVSFNLLILAYVKKIAFYPQSTMKYLKRQESITTTFQPNFEREIWYIDEQVHVFLKRIGRESDDEIKKRDALLCRNIVVYLKSIMSSKNKMVYCEKVQKASALLNHKNARNVVRKRQTIPYFDSVIKRFAMQIVYFLLRHKKDKIVFWVLSKL